MTDSEKPKGTAEWGERAGAGLVDIVISWGIATAVFVLSIPFFAIGGWAIAVGVLVVIAAIASLALYAPLLMIRQGERNGQTWGKQTVDITVVRENGQPITFWVAVLREFVVKQFIGVLLTGGLFWLIDSLWPLYDDRNMAIHDMIAETRVDETSSHR